jgi:pimeloyl-ACP methyl ester carboxylesterase
VRRSPRAKQSIVAAAIATLLGSSSLAIAAPAPPSSLGAEFYAKPGRLVRVEGRRRLNLLCVGKGSPVVVLESGAPVGAVAWRKVQGQIGQFTRACAYDRAGYGWSDPLTRTAHAENIEDDLHRLLLSAGITRPVVLVGHSAGGLYVQMYATDHPDAVAGVVLVDPTTRDEFRMVWDVLTEEERAETLAEFPTRFAARKSCVERARTGDLATSSKAGCRYPPTGDPALDAELRRQYALPKQQEAALSEITNFQPGRPDGSGSVTMEQAIAKPFRLGDKPLIMLRSSAGRVPPGERGERLKAASWADTQRVLSASPQARYVTVEGSGHVIQDDKPEVVIAAVREVVERVRSRGDTARKGENPRP